MFKLSQKTCLIGQSFFLLHSFLNTLNVEDHVKVRMLTLFRKKNVNFFFLNDGTMLYSNECYTKPQNATLAIF